MSITYNNDKGIPYVIYKEKAGTVTRTENH